MPHAVSRRLVYITTGQNKMQVFFEKFFKYDFFNIPSAKTPYKAAA